ncbi:MAG: glycosyltransferase family 9 protein [Candidatus Omnitrophica bacterium]|nr:glycosyltransferase family 9 protein [Candidatus Omnitrophota bacterium]
MAGKNGTGEKIMKVLFVNPFGIGDVLFTTPLLRALKERGHSLYYLCNERVQGIIRYNDTLSGIYPLSRGDIKEIFRRSPYQAMKRLFEIAKTIGRERFDIALDFSLDYRYSLFLRILGVKRIVGFDYKGRGRFLSDKITIPGFNDKHMVEYYAMLLDYVDKEARLGDKMELFIGGQDREWARAYLEGKGLSMTDTLIGIAPGGGASWGKDSSIKHWPKEKFLYVAEELTSDYGYKVILLGDKKEIDICDFIEYRLKKNVINACGKISIEQFAAVLEKTQLLIANDGGPLHVAHALGVKTVSIFGPVDEKVYGPYRPGKRHVVKTSDIECRPCYRNFKYSKCDNRVCLESIKPDEVVESVRNILE